ncbi:type II toxin-antitoxin system PemK/MazF family toxin [Paenibacillus xylanexedens]|uniref:type II toxin-antitoxin system PemK/MazF family toxin n=1 Tax=Paenibacillus xylanexedens TaxID=528191 RepID=UPI000F51F091|nr:type II toxin-antitoxin system PemK/MazF family toxin [Paenibacillus xylanexedens]
MADNTRNKTFMDKSKWSLIKKGWIFEAAVPYVGERPLDFFIPDSRTPYRGKVVSGTAVALSEDFTEGGDKEYQVVLNLKPRKVVVVSNDELNADTTQRDVMVAKLYTIKRKDKSEPWYPLAVSGSHPFFVYLGQEITGRECIIDLSTITTIHKNMLLQEKLDITPIMPAIESKIKYCFDLGLDAAIRLEDRSDEEGAS